VHASDRLGFLRGIQQAAQQRERVPPIQMLRSLPTCWRCRLAKPWVAQWLPRYR
jgi:hypothetical protein